MSIDGRDLKFPKYVWEAPVRIWHWVMALAMVVLCVTGYFIGAPLPSVPGEAIDNYLMGYMRFAHFAAGYVFAVVLLMRAYWAIVGNEFSREMFLVPLYVFRPSWWCWGTTSSSGGRTTGTTATTSSPWRRCSGCTSWAASSWW